MISDRILEVSDLRTRFHIAEGTVYAVNGISFYLIMVRQLLLWERAVESQSLMSIMALFQSSCEIAVVTPV
jgi:hypothetical protein